MKRITGKGHRALRAKTFEICLLLHSFLCDAKKCFNQTFHSWSLTVYFSLFWVPNSVSWNWQCKKANWMLVLIWKAKKANQRKNSILFAIQIYYRYSFGYYLPLFISPYGKSCNRAGRDSKKGNNDDQHYRKPSVQKLFEG